MPRQEQDLSRLHRLASQRGGVVSAEDLRACGYTASAIRHRLREGQWQRLGSAVILLPRTTAIPQLNDAGLAWTLQLTFGPRARVSGVLALRKAGWSLPSSVHIVATPDKPYAHLPGVQVIRRPDRGTAVSESTVRYEPGLVALVDCLTVLSPQAAANLLDAAIQRRYVQPRSLAAEISTRLGRGRRNATGLRALLERATSGSRSEAEQRMARLLARSGTGPWIPNRPVLDEHGRIVAEIDFAHEGLRIAIEVDGRAFHSDRRSFERDRERQNMLTLQGWLVLRFTWEQITEHPDEVIATVLRAVAQRSAA